MAKGSRLRIVVPMLAALWAGEARADVPSWTGVKKVAADSASATIRDTEVISLAASKNGRTFVQYGYTSQGAYASTVGLDGLAIPLSDPRSATGGSGDASAGLATPTCTDAKGEHDVAVGILNGLSSDGSPEIHVYAGANFDFSDGSGSSLMLPDTDPTRALLVGRYQPYTSDKFPPQPMNEAYLLLARMALNGCVLMYGAPSDPNYFKGKLAALPGVSIFFNVSAASRTASGGALVGGADDDARQPWIARANAGFDVTTTTHLAVSVPNGVPLAAYLHGIVEDASGHVFACGNAVQVRPPPGVGIESVGFVAMGDASLMNFSQVNIVAGDVHVGGCALGPDGKLVVSGWFRGKYGAVSSQGNDVFLAQVKAGALGPSVTKLARYGTSGSESDVSAPLMTAGGVVVAGVTTGNWGDASGAGKKVFLFRADPKTLTMH